MTDLTKSLEEMEGIADQADVYSGGEWEVSDPDDEFGFLWVTTPLDESGRGSILASEVSPEVAPHIATFDPPTVKALLRIAKAANDDRDCLSRPIRAALEALHTEGESDE